MAILEVGGCAGHGKNTPGKRSPNDEREWHFNNEVLLGFKAELETYKDVQFLRYDDPTGNRDVPLGERTDKANKDGVDYYISFHHNAYKGVWGNHTGTETFIQEGVNSADTLNFAKAIHMGAVKAYGLKDRGLKRADFHITRKTSMPACLVEGAYMDSKIDIAKLRDKQVLRNAGKQMAIEFAKYKKLNKKEVVAKPVTKPTPVSKPNSKVVYRVQVGAFGDKSNAEKLAAELKKKGYDAFIK